jgi:DNA-binding transcriptional regulator YiaG
MTMRNDEGEKLRRDIGRRASTRGPLLREVRERCKRYAVARSAAGTSQKVIAAELGVSAMSVQRWLRTKSTEAASAMVPVRVVATRAPLEPPSRLVVTTPRGLRVDGLDLETLCTLIVRLG